MKLPKDQGATLLVAGDCGRLSRFNAGCTQIASDLVDMFAESANSRPVALFLERFMNFVHGANMTEVRSSGKGFFERSSSGCCGVVNFASAADISASADGRTRHTVDLSSEKRIHRVGAGCFSRTTS